jgi:hypothetical protein
MNGANPELDRLRDDLATLRQATAVDVPFGRELVYFWAAVAAACGLLTFTLAMGPGAPVEPVVLGLWIAGAGLLLAAVVRFVRVVLRRAEQPAPWRDLREIAVAKLIGAPLMLGFLVWLYWVGAPFKIVLSVLVFTMSLATVMYALSNWTRRWAFGIALPGIALGFALPVLPAASVPLAVSAAGTAIGLLSALVHLRQLAAAQERG